jgi:hypothetical protein
MLLLGSLSLEIKLTHFTTLHKIETEAELGSIPDNTFVVQSLPFFVYNVFPRNTPSTYNPSLLCAQCIYVL